MKDFLGIKTLSKIYIQAFKEADQTGRQLFWLFIIKLIIFIIIGIIFFPKVMNQFETTEEKVNFVEKNLKLNSN